jgi:hypothetical protein
MDIEPLRSVESSYTAAAVAAVKHAGLNPAGATTFALLSTFMGICKVKDDSIVQAMQQARAYKPDHWQFYEARNIREEIAKSTLVQLRLQSISAPAQAEAAYLQQIAAYELMAKEQHQKKDELKTQAEKDQATYDALNFKDDQFDLSDALIAMAISLLAVASLTQIPWLFMLALFPSGFGVPVGLSGLVGLGIHPDVLIKLLS